MATINIRFAFSYLRVLAQVFLPGVSNSTRIIESSSYTYMLFVHMQIRQQEIQLITFNRYPWKLFELTWSKRRKYVILFKLSVLLLIVYTERPEAECARLRQNVPYFKVHRYNPKHLYPKLNGYGDNGERSLKVWQLLHTYWLPNTY